MAPPRPARMTYGGSPSNKNEQLQARGQLFHSEGGAAPASGRQQQQIAKEDLQYMSAGDILSHAVDQHKDTTAIAKRMLKVVEQTVELQATTVTELQDQGQQMQRIATGMDKIGTDITYSQRILRYMRMCCCFGFFCSCCTEPERRQEDGNWRGQAGGQGRPVLPPRKTTQRHHHHHHHHQQQQQQQQQSAKTAAAGGAAEPPAVMTAGLAEAGYGQQAAEIDAETKQQDQHLEQISNALDRLKDGALAMQDAVAGQQHGVERLQVDAHLLHGRLNMVNKDARKL